MYTGDRLTIRNSVAHGAFLGNLTLTTRPLWRERLSLTIGNILNRKYSDPGAEEHPSDQVAQQGRTVGIRSLRGDDDQAYHVFYIRELDREG